eukprot:1047977-Rhodomonas_salina.2
METCEVDEGTRGCHGNHQPPRRVLEVALWPDDAEKLVRVEGAAGARKDAPRDTRDHVLDVVSERFDAGSSDGSDHVRH